MDFAKQFRIPYWDWAARNEQIFPKEALNLGARVNGPPLSSAHTTTWDQDYNPLAAYKFDKNTSEKITVSLPKPFRCMSRTSERCLIMVAEVAWLVL